jgi:hypothetical protein
MKLYKKLETAIGTPIPGAYTEATPADVAETLAETSEIVQKIVDEIFDCVYSGDTILSPLVAHEAFSAAINRALSSEH